MNLNFAKAFAFLCLVCTCSCRTNPYLSGENLAGILTTSGFGPEHTKLSWESQNSEQHEIDSSANEEIWRWFLQAKRMKLRSNLVGKELRLHSAGGGDGKLIISTNDIICFELYVLSSNYPITFPGEAFHLPGICKALLDVGFNVEIAK